MAKVPAARRKAEERDGLDYDRLDGILGFQLRLAHTTMHRDFSSTLAALDLTQKQAAVLWLVNANVGVSQVELAAALRMDRATMMAIVDRLELRGLITRSRSTSDRRRQELQLTTDGERILAQAKQAISAHERRFVSKFSADELEIFIARLRTIQQAG